MLNRRNATLVIACAALTACSTGRKRHEEVMASQAEIKATQRAAAEAQEKMLTAQAASAARETEMLQVAKMGVTTQQEILTLSRDTNATTKANTETLDKTFREIYGVGIDMRAAIGETRVVIEVNNRMPLRVHSEMPGKSESQVVTKLPIGAVIFQSKQVSPAWWRGVILQEGQKTEVFFAERYTKPLRDELMTSGVASNTGDVKVDGAPKN